MAIVPQGCGDKRDKTESWVRSQAPLHGSPRTGKALLSVFPSHLHRPSAHGSKMLIRGQRLAVWTLLGPPTHLPLQKETACGIPCLEDPPSHTPSHAPTSFSFCSHCYTLSTWPSQACLTFATRLADSISILFILGCTRSTLPSPGSPRLRLGL